MIDESTLKYKEQTNCRICGHKLSKEVIDLNDQYLQGAFVDSEEKAKELNFEIPTKLVRCDNLSEGCSLVQLSVSVPQEILYSNYWYESAVNKTMRDHLMDICDDILKTGTFKENRVLDIGCNDGTLLKNYPDHIEKWGVDPSDISKRVSGEINVISATFPSDKVKTKLGGIKFDVVTTIAMFYDLPDPVDFAINLHGLLNDTGIWVLELSYLPLMLEMNSFDTICHEHLEYYKLSDLELIAKKSGFQAISCELNYINGGSIRIKFAKKSDNHSIEEGSLISKLRKLETELKYNESMPYDKFKTDVNLLKEKTINLLRRINDEGKTIHIYGASTKGNVLLQYYGVDNKLVQYASDRNPNKVGSRTLGTNIEIISEESSRAMTPDYYFVLPWHFRAEFLIREREAIMNGTKMIFPLPNISIVDSDNIDEVISISKKPLDFFLEKYGLL